MGYAVRERKFDVLEMLDWVRTAKRPCQARPPCSPRGYADLCGGIEHKVAGGQVGPITQALRAKLVAVQQGEAPDLHGWLERV